MDSEQYAMLVYGLGSLDSMKTDKMIRDGELHPQDRDLAYNRMMDYLYNDEDEDE